MYGEDLVLCVCVCLMGEWKGWVIISHYVCIMCVVLCACVYAWESQGYVHECDVSMWLE
jgi:hypothetical protein